MSSLFLVGCSALSEKSPPVVEALQPETPVVVAEEKEEVPEPPCECPPPEPVECPEVESKTETTNPPPKKVEVKAVNEKIIIGEVEKFTLHPWGWHLDGRVDTGATTSSMHAENITYFERDGKRWVRFDLEDPETLETHEVEKRVKRRVIIKSNNEEEKDRRPVIEMVVSIGDIKQNLEFTLTNREDFEYVLLIGRNFLRDMAIVDVSKHHVIKLKKPKAADK